MFKVSHQFIFRFSVKVTKNEKNQLSCLFIFCIFLKITADFFSFFGQSDQKMKNEKWNEPYICLQRFC